MAWARALLHGEPLVGYWFNRTQEYYARRKGIKFDKYDFATRYEIELKRLPAFADDSPEQYQAMIAEILLEIDEEGAAARRGRKVLGVEKILAQDPCKPLATGTGKKSPAPMLFFSTRPEVRGKMADDYRNFIDDYRLGSARMLRAAQRGYRLDSRHCLPDGSFPPAVVEAMLRASSGFNPETAFPQRCFPRAWPFVGGDLAPPSRERAPRSPSSSGLSRKVWAEASSRRSVHPRR